MVSHDHGASWSLPRYVEPDHQASAADLIGAHDGILAEAYVVDPSSSGYKDARHPAVRCAQPCAMFETTTDYGVSWKRHVMPVAAVGGDAAEEGPMRDQTIVAADPTAKGRFAVLVPTLQGTELQIWKTPDSGRSWQKLETLAAHPGQTMEKYWLASARMTSGPYHRHAFWVSDAFK